MLLTTTFISSSRSTSEQTGCEPVHCPDELLDAYHRLVGEQRWGWTQYSRLMRLLGVGGQGVVYLSERRGSDNFTLPVALKIFSPERYKDSRAYDMAMGRIARVSSRVAQLQQDNLLDVHNFVERRCIRIMEMEWIDGYDLARLLTPDMLEKLRVRGPANRWAYLNDVVVTSGPVQPRLKPGIAVAVTRECLAALSALHRESIVHGDVKPSNIMIKKTGNAKIVDIGSAFEINDPPPRHTCTPYYAAPEVLEAGECTAQSDLASLGYVLVEMLSGRPLFAGIRDYRELLEAKRMLPQQLPELLPQEVTVNKLLMRFLRGMVAPDPAKRFPSAEAADLKEEGAAAFHYQLVKGDLASDYKHEMRLWLQGME